MAFRTWHLGLVAAILISGMALNNNESRRIFLYAWERPEDLRFLEGTHSTIAYYALGIEIRGDSFKATPRRNPLDVPEDATMIPVVRIDVFGSDKKIGRHLDEAIQVIIATCKNSSECQIDHDAVASGIDEYVALLTRLKEEIPNMRLSVTALASWCTDRSWLQGAPVDYAVPMLYRMAADEANFKQNPGLLSEPKCGGTIALSLDELDFNPKPHAAGRAVFLFNPQPWTANAYQYIREALGQ